MQQAEQQDAAMRQYVQNVTASGGPPTRSPVWRTCTTRV